MLVSKAENFGWYLIFLFFVSMIDIFENPLKIPRICWLALGKKNEKSLENPSISLLYPGGHHDNSINICKTGNV